MTIVAKSSTFTAVAAVAFAAGVVLMFVSMFRQSETPTLIVSMAAYAVAIVCWAMAAKLRGQ
jgi:cadmium resistance protein CadD (predicted permease)